MIPVPYGSLEEGAWAEEPAIIVGTAPGIPPAYRLAENPAAPLVFVAEVEIYAPSLGLLDEDGTYGVNPEGALSQEPTLADSSEIIRASDGGYRSSASDVGGVRAYPPVLSTAFDLDRAINLAPGASAIGAAAGYLRLLNAGGRYDGIAASRNPDGRPVRVLAGRRRRVPALELYTSPPLSDLAPIVSAIGLPWTLSETELEIPLRDATYLAEKPYQESVYAGTGGLEGTAEIKGRPKPRTRGGTAEHPVASVSPVLVDPVARIYQWTDGRGSLVALYEGGAPVFSFGGDVADLYAGSTAAGAYRTDSARGLFQLGSRPGRPITADVTGEFPISGQVSAGPAMALAMLREDLAIPAQYIEAGSFTGLLSAAPYPCGIFVAGETDALEPVDFVLRSVGARLLPTRAGRLRAILLRGPLTAAPAVRYSAATIGRLRPVSLDSAISPSPRRIRVLYGRVHTVQSSDLSDVLTEARRQAIAEEWRTAAWGSAANALAYRRATDPEPIQTALLREADAQALADSLGALWGAQRRLYEAELPAVYAARHEIGEVLQIAFPLHDLTAGRPAQIVAERWRGGLPEATLRLLV